MCTDKGRKMGEIPSGKGGERFPVLFPLKKSDFGGDLGRGGGRRRPWTRCGQGGAREEKGGWGTRDRRPRTLALSRQPAWRDRLVAPLHVARQVGPRHRRRVAALARAASVATLSRHMHWRDRGYLSRRGKWCDQTDYFLQIKTNTG